MPELPEVETSRRGIAPLLSGQAIAAVHIRQPRLRWPVPAELAEVLPGQRVQQVSRRGKYLLLECQSGTLILHLGMSGSLRVLDADSPPGRHDHFDLELSNGRCLRLRDPRRFGAVLWTEQAPDRHPLLARLGPEPLGPEFSGERLYRLACARRSPVKGFVMDSSVVVGVGNIYANEALFLAGIHPHRPCNRIALARYQRLAESIRGVLARAIEAGGTTLRDFQQEDGRPGYFAQSLQVYGRTGEPCPRCSAPLRQRRIGQRSSFFCQACQR